MATVLAQVGGGGAAESLSDLRGMGDVIRWERHAVWAGAVLVRVGILIFGAWQDAHCTYPAFALDGSNTVRSGGAVH